MRTLLLAGMLVVMATTAGAWSTTGGTTFVGPPGTGLVCVLSAPRAQPGSGASWNQYVHHAACYYGNDGCGACDDPATPVECKEAPNLVFVPEEDVVTIAWTCPRWPGRAVACEIDSTLLYGTGASRFKWKGGLTVGECDYTGTYP